MGQLEKQFDLIEAFGVLHHLKDPILGWQALSDILRVGRIMNVGLYSGVAREHIKRRRSQLGNSFSFTKGGAAELREDIIRSHHADDVLLRQSNDFFASSSFRDLLLHVDEHHFP